MSVKWTGEGRTDEYFQGVQKVGEERFFFSVIFEKNDRLETGLCFFVFFFSLNFRVKGCFFRSGQQLLT